MVNYSQKSLLGDYLYRSVLNVKSEGHPSSEISWSLDVSFCYGSWKGPWTFLCSNPSLTWACFNSFSLGSKEKNNRE